MVSEKTIQWTIVLSRLEHIAHGYFPMLYHHFNLTVIFSGHRWPYSGHTNFQAHQSYRMLKFFPSRWVSPVSQLHMWGLFWWPPLGIHSVWVKKRMGGWEICWQVDFTPFMTGISRDMMVCRGIWWPIIYLIMDPNFNYHQVGWNLRLNTCLAALWWFTTAVEHHQFNRYIGKSFKKKWAIHGEITWNHLSNGQPVAAQVMFDYPTVADLTDFIVAQFSEGEDDAEGALGGDSGGGTMVEATEGWNHGGFRDWEILQIINPAKNSFVVSLCFFGSTED